MTLNQYMAILLLFCFFTGGCLGVFFRLIENKDNPIVTPVNMLAGIMNLIPAIILTGDYWLMIFPLCLNLGIAIFYFVGRGKSKE